jgi:molybdopterin-binding protein
MICIRFRVITSLEGTVRLSTRNQLAGTVTAINPGSVMSTVKVDVSGQEVTAAVTKEAVEELGLSVGDPVVVLVKSTDVMLGVPD